MKRLKTSLPSISFWLFLILLFVVRFYVTRPVYKIGDKVRISGRMLSQPPKIASLRFYLPNQDVSYGDKIIIEGVVAENNLLKNPKLIKLETNNNILFITRTKIINFYRRAFPEPYSSLIAGVTLGNKTGIPTDFWQSLVNSGTAHVVVASGMNVSLVAGVVLSTLILIMRRRYAVILVICTIWVYAVISGFEAPIVRAAVMGSLTFTAVGLGRVSLAWRILFLTALCMLIFVPDWVTDLGFWLSFTATASLMLFQKKLDSWIHLPTDLKFLKEGLTTSLAAQIGVGPILYYAFGTINILSPLINALVLWTIAPMTIIGMLAGIISLVYEPLAKLILFLAYPLAWWFVLIT